MIVAPTQITNIMDLDTRLGLAASVLAAQNDDEDVLNAIGTSEAECLTRAAAARVLRLLHVDSLRSELELVAVLDRSGLLEAKLFLEELHEHLPIQMKFSQICWLSAFGYITLSQFLHRFSSDRLRSEAMTRMASEIESDDTFSLVCLLRWAFTGRPSPEAVDLFDSFLDVYFERSPCSASPSPFRLLNSMPSLDDATVKRSYLHVIDRLVHADSRSSSLEALRAQESWLEEFEASQTGLLADVVELLVPFAKSEIEEVLARAMHKKPLSWKNFLMIFWVALRYADIDDLAMEGHLSALLWAGIENADEESFCNALLVARAICWCRPSTYSFAYGAWFAGTFGSEAAVARASSRGGASTAKPLKLISGLVALLTRLVPAESSSCLRAHLARPPFVPLTAKPVWLDYVSLARTRIADLSQQQAPAASTAFTLQAGNNSITAEVKDDVRRALDTFEKTGNISHFVLQARMFRKAYYFEQFIPALKAQDTDKVLVKDFLEKLGEK